MSAWVVFKSIELQKDVPNPGVDVSECLRDLEAYGIHSTDAHILIADDAIR
jgi:hypothetical protein